MHHPIRLPVSCFILLVMLTAGCKKEEKEEGALPILITYEVQQVRRTSAVCGGYVVAVGSGPVTDFGVCWDTVSPPAADRNFTTGGEIPFQYYATLHGLKPNTTYYVSAYARNKAGVGYGDEMTFKTEPAAATITFNSDLVYDAVADVDGNVYKTIGIGSQTWMAENLRTTRYNDQTEIPLVTGDTAWSSLQTPGYCWYEDNEAVFKNIYGAYYNWFTVNTGKLCPSGWHVPSDGEWKVLEMELGMTQEEADELEWRGIEAVKLKETGTMNWYQDVMSAEPMKADLRPFREASAFFIILRYLYERGFPCFLVDINRNPALERGILQVTRALFLLDLPLPLRLHAGLKRQMH